MRIHVLAVPHAQTTREFSGCAFTGKVWKFLKMMSGRGHEIFHYGHKNTDWSYPDVEHVPVIDDTTVELAYGRAYTEQKAWKTLGFAHYYNTQDLVYRHFHQRATQELLKRAEPTDLVLHFFGWGTEPISHRVQAIHVEPGIGYSSAWARWRVYESHSLMMAIAGADAVQHCRANWYHRVIPNYFDSEDFDYQEQKGRYMLFLGRIGTHKGADIAVELARHTGCELVVAGQGTLKSAGIENIPATVTEVGYADPELRRTLMSNARALFIGSTYHEPFGGVQIEAFLSGTPVISPDWAAFAEYNLHGQTGYRCHTFGEFVQAWNRIDQIDPRQCRQHGEQFLLETIAPKYESYFQDLENVYTGKGWYTV